MSIVKRQYKNTQSSSAIHVSKVRMPSKFISGCVVDMFDRDSNATPSQVKTLKAYQSIFRNDASYKFNADGHIVVENDTHMYTIGRGGGVVATYIKVAGVWKYIG